MAIVLQHFHEFAAGRGPSIRQANGVVLFSDGSRSDGQFDHREPPADRIERLKVQRAYHKLRVAKLDREFAGEADRLRGQSEYGPLDPRELAALRQAKANRDEARAALADVEQQIRAATPQRPADYIAQRREELAIEGAASRRAVDAIVGADDGPALSDEQE